MTTWQASNVNAGTSKGVSASPGGEVRVISKVVDFAVVLADVGTIGTTDVIEVLPVPAHTLVLAAGIEVITPEGTNTTATLALGDGADPDRYVAASTIATAGTQETVVNSTSTFAYTSADTLDLTIATDDPTDAVVRVWAVVADLATAAKDTDYDSYSA